MRRRTRPDFGTRANKSDEWGWELSNLITNWNISFPDAHFAGTANSQHVMAYVSPKQDPSADMLLAFDGTSKTNSSWKSGSFGGFMKRCNLTELTIGGFGTPSAPTSAWNGGIDYVIITDEVLTQDEINKITRMEDVGEAVVPGADIGEMFNNAYGDNSWVFTGGEDVQGGFDQVGGARNYIGQFEEYVRWKQSGNENGRQRYTINTAKKGQTLADVVTNWENRVAAYNPKAVAYMVGHEDYSQGTAGVENFKTQLKQFINKATAMRENKGFAVIQKPYATNDTATNTKIQAYCDAVDAVVTEYAQDAKYARIVVVDHFTQTKDNADFKANKLTGNKLNKLGHFEIGKQFSDATMKTTAGYPADIALMNQTVEPAAEVYSKVVPTVNAESRTLNVEIGGSRKFQMDIYIKD